MDDESLLHAVREELDWAPHLDAGHIEVQVRDGIVRLTGVVASLAEKRAAERAVWHLRGVRGLAQELEVRLPEASRPSDDEVAHRALSLLRWDAQLPEERLRLKVERGAVTLMGTVDRHYQKREAEERIARLAGVVAVDNRILVRPTSAPEDVKAKVERALHRHAELDASRIAVAAEGAKVILAGEVGSLHARGIAENAAWSAAGVAEVEDRLEVRP